MKREEVLEQARICVCGDRQQDYGSPEDNFITIAQLWSVYLRAAKPGTGLCIAAKDVAAMMALLKIARIAAGDKLDNFIDLAGYAACGGEIASQEKEKKQDDYKENFTRKF